MTIGGGDGPSFQTWKHLLYKFEVIDFMAHYSIRASLQITPYIRGEIPIPFKKY